MSRYADAKPYALTPALADLTGPMSGTAELPRHLGWGPTDVYDLGDEADLTVMYERVIREAQGPEDVETFLNASVLRRLWPRLVGARQFAVPRRRRRSGSAACLGRKNFVKGLRLADGRLVRAVWTWAPAARDVGGAQS